MAFNPITNTEIVNGAPADTALFNKVKNNFDNHEMRLVSEEADLDVIRAYQILVDDEDEIYDATDIEQALAEVMHLALDNQDYNVSVFNNFGPRISTLEDRSDDFDVDLDTLFTNLSTLTGRVTSTESVNLSQDSAITNLQGRMTTAEGNIVSLQNNIPQLNRNTTQLSMQVASIDKADFLTRLVVNTGSLPVYNSTAANQTGVGVLTTTEVAQEITYDTFIPVNIAMGSAMVVTFSAPVGTSVTYGFKCYDNTQALITTKNIVTDLGATAAFQYSQGHFKASGVGAENFPSGTRFVKPFISWTGNTGTFTLDFLGVNPLGFSQYALFVD